MNMIAARSLTLLALAAAVACDDGPTNGKGADRLYGRWQKTENTLPPVTLQVRQEGGATVGQVWLSGTTYTLPATLDDTMVVLANPVSSAPAPFVAVLKADGTLHATLRSNTSDVTAILHRAP